MLSANIAKDFGKSRTYEAPRVVKSKTSSSKISEQSKKEEVVVEAPNIEDITKLLDIYEFDVSFQHSFWNKSEFSEKVRQKFLKSQCSVSDCNSIAVVCHESHKRLLWDEHLDMESETSEYIDLVEIWDK